MVVKHESSKTVYKAIKKIHENSIFLASKVGRPLNMYTSYEI